MEVIHPDLNKPVPVVGVHALYLVSRTVVYDPGPPPVSMELKPKDNDIAVVLNPVPGGPEAASLLGAIATVDFDPGVSTPVSLQAVVAAVPVVTGVMSIIGPATVIPVGFAGGTYQLFLRRPIPPALMCIVDGDGNVVPFSGKSISIAVTVPADRDNAYDCIAVDLNVNRAAGVEITKGGGSLVGRDLAVIKTDGDFILRFNNNANDDIPQTTTDHGSFENTDFTKVFLQHAPLGAGKKAYLYVGRKV